MFLSNASVKRPVAISCFIIALMLLGLNSYRKMGLEFLPRMDVPFITIITIYPGASPKDIELDVAKPIEDQMVTIEGLKHVTSTCMENQCQTFLEFNMDVDVDIAAMDVREKLDLIKADFPADVEDPKVMKFYLNTIPILTLAISGSASLSEQYEYADNELRDKISVITGVADVQVLGGAEREVVISLDRNALAARGLTTTDVVQVISHGLKTIPAGRLKDAGMEYSVKFDAEYYDVDNLGYLEVVNKDGSRSYLKDIAHISIGTEEYRQRAFLDGKPAIIIRVVKKAEANVVQVVERVKQQMDSIIATMPGGMELVWVSDDGGFIRSSVADTQSSIILGIILTATILFLFLYNIRATIIVAITMPLTILISLFSLYLAGQTLNVLTLMAIGLSVGVLVTNSIVVLESIERRAESLPDVREAARIGAQEVAVAVLASAGTNIVVLFPIAMMGSKVGQVFKAFATTMVIVTIASLFISFTLTPILYLALMRGKQNSNSQGLLSKIEKGFYHGFDLIAAGYSKILEFVAHYRVLAIIILIISALFLLQSLALVPKLGFSMMSDADMGIILVKLEFPTHYNLDRTTSRVHEVEEMLKDLPHLQYMSTTVGKLEGMIGQSSEGVHLAQISLKFTDKTERDVTIYSLLEETRARITNFTDCMAIASVSSMGPGQGFPVELEISGSEWEVLDQLALKTADIAREVPGLTSIDTSVRAGKPEIIIQPNRPVLADLGMPVTGLGMTLRGNLEGIEAGRFKQGDRTIDIRVKLSDEEGKSQVESFLFPGGPGKPITLGNVGTVKEDLAPILIIRSDKQRTTKVYSNLESWKPLGNAVVELGELIDNKADFPPGYRYRFVGDYEILQEVGLEFLEVAIIAIVLTYLLLAAILESFTQPFIILVTLPLGLIGVLWALWIAGESISMFVMLGSVMLVGIVVNNAILIMDRVNYYVAAGKSHREAMVHAAADELRPIVMITLAAMLGMMPLALGRGLGSEIRTGIGIASVGGIFVSALLTLVVLPILYDLFTREKK